MPQASKGLRNHVCCNISPWNTLWEQLAQTGDCPAMSWNYRDEEAGGTPARMARFAWWLAESLEC